MFEEIVIPSLGEDQDVEVKFDDNGFVSLKELINILIDFINKLLKFEF